MAAAAEVDVHLDGTESVQVGSSYSGRDSCSSFWGGFLLMVGNG